IPSPTWSTVPTSARSVSTSYSSIRCLRIEVISSGRSFTATPCCRRGLPDVERGRAQPARVAVPIEDAHREGERSAQPPAWAPEQRGRGAVHAAKARADARDRLPGALDRDCDPDDVAVVRGREAQAHRLAGAGEA